MSDTRTVEFALYDSGCVELFAFFFLRNACFGVSTPNLHPTLHTSTTALTATTTKGITT